MIIGPVQMSTHVINCQAIWPCYFGSNNLFLRTTVRICSRYRNLFAKICPEYQSAKLQQWSFHNSPIKAPKGCTPKNVNRSLVHLLPASSNFTDRCMSEGSQIKNDPMKIPKIPGRIARTRSRSWWSVRSRHRLTRKRSWTRSCYGHPKEAPGVHLCWLSQRARQKIIKIINQILANFCQILYINSNYSFTFLVHTT